MAVESVWSEWRKTVVCSGLTDSFPLRVHAEPTLAYSCKPELFIWRCLLEIFILLNLTERLSVAILDMISKQHVESII